MLYDIRLTAEQLAAAAAWAVAGKSFTAVELKREPNGSITVAQGDDQTVIGAPMKEV